MHGSLLGIAALHNSVAFWAVESAFCTAMYIDFSGLGNALEIDGFGSQFSIYYGIIYAATAALNTRLRYVTWNRGDAVYSIPKMSGI